jgi:hypothetical protein
MEPLSMGFSVGDHRYSRIERKKEVEIPDFLCDIFE